MGRHLGSPRPSFWALPRPSRLQALPQGSQQMGSGACPGPLPEACARGQFPAERHPLSSVQLAKFSEDTLSSYTEAVSTQVRSPGKCCPRPLLEPWHTPIW